MNSFMGIEIGKRGVLTTQSALSVTGHNISNASTPGYTRQVANLTTTTPWYTPNLAGGSKSGQYGTGVDVSSIDRIRDQFVDAQLRNETKTAGYWNSLQDTLAKIETVVNEPTDEGLRSVIEKFWKAWEDLSGDAESDSTRTVVAETGQSVAEAFNHAYKQLTELREDVNNTIKVDVDQVNSLAQQIAALNKQIMAITAAGKQPNDLLDQRDYLIDQLSEIAEVSVYNDDNGMISLQLGDRMLVQGVEYNQLDTKPDIKGMYAVVWEDTQALAVINSGEMKGLLDARGKTEFEKESSRYKEIIPNAIEDLNTMAKTIILKTNEVHRAGWSLNNKRQTPDGTNFFVEPEEPLDSYINWADFMKVNQEIVDDGKNIAAAVEPTWNTSGAKANFGDGNNALAIARLKQSLNSTVFAARQQKTDNVARAADPVNDDVSINFYLNYDGDQIYVSVTGKYDTVEERAQAIEDAISGKIGASRVDVQCEGNRIVFCSSDPKFESIDDLEIRQNAATIIPTLDNVENINGETQTGDIAFTAGDPITFKFEHAGRIYTVAAVTGYTSLEERAKAVQDAINTQLGASLAEPVITVQAYGEKLVFCSNDNKLEKISDFTVGPSGSETNYGDFHVMMVQDATVDDFWSAMVSEIGVKSQEAERMVLNQETLITELENKRQSVSGVSLDEEMTNMIKFQHGFNAASRFITTIDEALNTIINSMGLVGR
jgi:flagellar hook-associated protein FlgK